MGVNVIPFPFCTDLHVSVRSQRLREVLRKSLISQLTVVALRHIWWNVCNCAIFLLSFLFFIYGRADSLGRGWGIRAGECRY